jgi:hypothetical protein
MTYTKADVGRSINVLGRVVSAPREFPRQKPIAYIS